MAQRPLLQGGRVKLSADLAGFSARIGHQFRRPELLLRAVTHSSLASATRPSNERLEFLGDRVLGLTMAEALFSADRGAAEGLLAPRFNALVRQETCADVAREVGLGDVLKLGRSEMMTGGRRKEALLGDAMEAVIAAVYLDAGFETARPNAAAPCRARYRTRPPDRTRRSPTPSHPPAAPLSGARRPSFPNAPASAHRHALPPAPHRNRSPAAPAR